MKKLLLYSLIALLVVILPAAGLFNAKAGVGFTDGLNRKYMVDLRPYNGCREHREILDDLYLRNIDIFYSNLNLEIEEMRNDLLDKAKIKKQEELQKVDRAEQEHKSFIASKTIYFSTPSPLEEEVWTEYDNNTKQSLEEWREAIIQADQEYRSEITKYTINNDQYPLSVAIRQAEIAHRAEADLAIREMQKGCSRNFLDRTRDLKAAQTFIDKTIQIDNKYERQIRQRAFSGKIKSDISNQQAKRSSAWNLARQKYQGEIKQYRTIANKQINTIRQLDNQTVRNFCDRDLENTIAKDLDAINNSDNSFNNWYETQERNISSERQRNANRFETLTNQSRRQIEDAITRAEQKYRDKANCTYAINNYRESAESRLNIFVSSFEQNRATYDNATTAALAQAKERGSQNSTDYINAINASKEKALQGCSRLSDGHRSDYNVKSSYQNEVKSARNRFNDNNSSIKSNFSAALNQATNNYKASYSDIKSDLNSGLAADKAFLQSQINAK